MWKTIYTENCYGYLDAKTFIYKNNGKNLYCNIAKPSTDPDRITSANKSVAERGLAAQKGDEVFDLRSRIFMSITQRFDLVTKSKVEKTFYCSKFALQFK